MSIQSTIELAVRRWPNLTFKKKNNNEAYSSFCPFCGQGTDRFLIFCDSIRYWCRYCDANGKLIEDEFEKRLSDVELQVIRQQAEISRLEQEAKDRELRLQAIETMLSCTSHVTYHETMPDEARDYWHEQGINDDSIERWKLGYTQHIPLWQSRAGYTIPVINNGKLRDIRYRMIYRETDDKKRVPKYLPHCKNLPPTLFNADCLINPQGKHIYIGEGEKKVIVAEQHRFPFVGILGKNKFDKRWIKWFLQFDKVFVCLDSDALDKASQLALLFGLKGRIVELPEPGKLDDLFNQGFTRNDFCQLLRKARMP
jgi:DNA primase